MVTTVKFTETDRMDQPVSAIGWLDTFVMMFPRWKRATLASVATMISVFCTGYVIGTLFIYLMAGAYALTASMFIVWMLYITMYVVAFYAGSKVGKFVSDFIMDDGVGKKMESIASSAKDKVTGWFSKSKVEVMP